MADTTYTDNVTVITADTMNDLNRLHYTVLGDPATGAAASWKLITDLTADATPDVTADYVVTSDASASTGKKVLLKNLFAGTGSVGIGTASPASTLHVYGSSSTQCRVESGDDTGGQSRYINTVADYSAGITGATTGTFIIFDNTNTHSAYAYTPGASGYHSFYTQNTERVRIDANGYLLVGYTSSQGAFKLQVNDQIFATNATISTSDGRYKQNVTPITGALDLVAALRPVSYRWRAHPVHDFDLSGDHLGFIAQEVDQALAGTAFRAGIVKSNRAVAKRGDRGVGGRPIETDVDEEFLGLAEGKLVPILAAAVKELNAIVDAQAVRIAALEAR
jgi:hypothetical protein